MVVDRLVEALVAAGASHVVHPVCFGCGTTRGLTQRIDGLRACNWCAIKARPETCSRCGKDPPVSTRDAAGAVCYQCHGADPTTFEVCIACSRPRRVVRRTPEGPRCRDCWRPRAVVACSVCGEVRVSTTGIQKGRPKCTSCVRRRTTCSACGKGDRMIAMVFATGPVCSTCHKKAQSAKGVCRGCGQRRRIDPRDPDQRGLCSDCAGLEPWSVCTVCGGEDRIYEAGRCIACTLEHRLRELLGSSAMLDPLLDCLGGSERPRAALRWLAKPASQEVLGAMARGDMASTHEALDEQPPTPAREHLRQVLVTAGVFPARDEQSVRLETWVAEQLDAVESAEDRKVVDAFARWWVLQRYRRRIERTGRSSSSHSRRQIRAAIAFMGWLRAHGVGLGECTQAHVELWLAGPPERVAARDFIRWACRRRLASGIDIGRRPDPTPGRGDDGGQLVATARRFASDDTLPHVDRVAGLLLLCYGPRPHRQAEARRRRARRRRHVDPVRVHRDDPRGPGGPAGRGAPRPSAGQVDDGLVGRQSMALPRRSAGTADHGRRPRAAPRVIRDLRSRGSQHRPAGPGRRTGSGVPCRPPRHARGDGGAMGAQRRRRLGWLRGSTDSS